MPCQSIRESVVVKAVKYITWDEAGVERHRHERRDRYQELGFNSWVSGDRDCFSCFSFIDHLRYFMLNLVTDAPGV